MTVREACEALAETRWPEKPPSGIGAGDFVRELDDLAFDSLRETDVTRTQGEVILEWIGAQEHERRVAAEAELSARRKREKIKV